MRIRSTAAAVAAVLTLGACGGGSPAPTADVAAAGAVQQLRVRAFAVAAATVEPAEAARQLMDFGQAQFPQYFPSPVATQTFGPFLFRHYPQTGIYLGVVVQEGQGYPYLGVYVMGGPFGEQPQFVGPLASFITPQPPATGGPGPTGASNGCYDQMLAAEAPGTRYVQVQQHRVKLAMGESLFTQTIDLTVRGPAVFEGHDVVESLQRGAEGAFAEGIPDGTAESTDLYVYQRRTGPAEITFYGSTAPSSTRTQTVGGITITTTGSSRSVNVPPRVVTTFSVPLGGSTTISTTYHNRSTTTTTVTGRPPTTFDSDTQEPSNETVRFVRRERITVPAGTFDACVFESTSLEAPDTVTTEWVADGKGFPLQLVVVSGGAVVSTLQTLSIRLNGQPPR